MKIPFGVRLAWGGSPQWADKQKGICVYDLWTLVDNGSLWTFTIMDAQSARR
jgi:hypothetical protein